ncbi:MAG TPA: outer membrane protein assembly factor BamE [Desulfobaccales bacterium]
MKKYRGESMKHDRQRSGWRVFFLALLAGLIIAGLTGCAGSKINQDNFNQIKLGMSQEEVQRILGPPTESSGLEVPIFSGTMSKWIKGDVAITIQFVNGKVVAKEFSKPPNK